LRRARHWAYLFTQILDGKVDLPVNMEMERDSRKIAKRLEAEGWTLVPGGKGSHRKYTRPGFAMIILPFPKKDLPIGTARNIAKAAGWIS
jgi:predicted RNA binding protein YcfA (HicA-like mRNA interferase family)